MTGGPDSELAARLTATLGAKPLQYVSFAHRGCADNLRWRAILPGGGSVFVRAVVDATSAAWLRAEYFVYSPLRTPFLRRLPGWIDDSALPVLILAHSSAAFGPPPWDEAQIA